MIRRPVGATHTGGSPLRGSGCLVTLLTLGWRPGLFPDAPSWRREARPDYFLGLTSNSVGFTSVAGPLISTGSPNRPLAPSLNPFSCQ